MKDNSACRREVLDELIQNATELPVEGQSLLLMLAKGMAYTRNCLLKQNAKDQTCISYSFTKQEKGDM